jgi:hypothetical protein
VARKSGAVQARRTISRGNDPASPDRDSTSSQAVRDKNGQDRSQMLVRISNELKFWVTVMAADDGISATEFVEKATAREVQRRFGDEWASLQARAKAVQPVLAEIAGEEEHEVEGGDS